MQDPQQGTESLMTPALGLVLQESTRGDRHNLKKRVTLREGGNQTQELILRNQTGTTATARRQNINRVNSRALRFLDKYFALEPQPQ